MHLHDIAVASGYLGAALGVAMVVPQIVRTLADRHRPGVSALSWALTALSCTSWLLYGIRAGEPPQIPGNVLLIAGAWLIVLIVPSSVRARARAARLAGPAALLVALAAVAPPPVLGAVGFAIGLVSSVPQIVTSLSRRRSGESAVSLLTWCLRVLSQAAWLGYAVVLGDLTVAVSASLLLTNAALVVAVELVRRPTPVPAVAMA